MLDVPHKLSSTFEEEQREYQNIMMKIATDEVYRKQIFAEAFEFFGGLDMSGNEARIWCEGW